MGRSKGWLAAIVAVFCLCGAAGDAAAALKPPTGDFVPGVVEPPALGLALHGDVVWHSPAGAAASAAASGADTQTITTPDGLRVKVETSPRYEPSLEYDEGLVAYLDSLVHGNELGGLEVYVATPSQMVEFCGGQAAACYVPLQGRIYIVGQATFGGFPTDYVLAHEYGHRIEDYRHNPPFPGGPLLWGTKRWASVMGVCRGYLNNEYAPGNEGRHYFENPGEAFAESYAWSHFGPGLVEWRWVASLHPNAAAYAAIRNDILNPWTPQRLERQGRLRGPNAQRIYRLRPKSDGLLRVTMTGSGAGNLDLALLSPRGRVLAASAGRHGSSDHLNFLVCGDRNLRLAVLGDRPPNEYQLKIQMP